MNPVEIKLTGKRGATCPVMPLKYPPDDVLGSDPRKLMQVVTTLPTEGERNFLLILMAFEAVMFQDGGRSEKKILADLEHVVSLLARITGFLNEYDDLILHAEKEGMDLFTPAEGLDVVFRDFMMERFGRGKKTED